MSYLPINTTQNVIINFNTASVGDRLLASIVDILIKLAYAIVIIYLFNLLEINKIVERLDSWSIMSIIIFFAFPVLIYSLVLESLFEGQTLGKKLLKIKVVKIDGYQASLGDYFIRWLFRIVENNILGGLIGLLVMVLNKNTQRLGDIAAGTAVLTLKNSISIKNTILEEIEEEYIPKYASVIKLSDNDVRIIKETYLVAIKKKDTETLNTLVQKIETVVGIKCPPQKQEEFIKTILKDYNFFTQNM